MDDSEVPRLYAGWTVERWETPVSDARSLRLVSLLDDGALRITLEDGRDPARSRWRFTFRHPAAYLNLLEEYRLELWGMRAPGERPGWTVRVPNSPWLTRLRQAESLVDVHHPGLMHFQIGTEDDVIDVLASEEPQIEELGAAPEGSPPAGKSTIMHYPEDRAEFEQLVESLRPEQRQGESGGGDA